MRHALFHSSLAIAAALGMGAAVGAEDIAAAVSACRSEVDDARRLACYDRAAGRAKAAEPMAPPPAASQPAASASAAAASPEDNFGRERQVTYEEDQKRAEATRAVGELQSIDRGHRKAHGRPPDLYARERPGVAAGPAGLEVQHQRRRRDPHPARLSRLVHPVRAHQEIDAGDAGQVNGRTRARLLEMRRVARRPAAAGRAQRVLPRLPGRGARLPDVPVLRPVQGEAVRRAGRRSGAGQGTRQFLRLLRACRRATYEQPIRRQPRPGTALDALFAAKK